MTDLPQTFAIFPLAGALLLPGGRLPLNIFEPRYLDMVNDALKEHRNIGMIQPTDPRDHDCSPKVYDIGCLGRIVSFKETDDGRYLITLKGLSRFSVVDELAVTTRYRQVMASFGAFANDPEPEDDTGFNRTILLEALRPFLKMHEVEVEWDAIENVPGLALITSLAMTCPFAPNEKQALLEAPSLAERTQLITSMIEMALAQRGAAPNASTKDIN